MEFKEKLIALLDSDLTSYSIVKELKEQGYKTSTQFLDDYRNGKKDVESMTLGKAEMLVDYYDYKQKEEIEMTEEKIREMIKECLQEIFNELVSDEDSQVVDSETFVELLDWYYEPSNEYVYQVSSGMAYDGIDKEAYEVCQTEGFDFIN